jgi:O-methyltransferase involved in polyketide biosynthesis
VPEREVLEILVGHLARNPKVGAAGGLVLNPKTPFVLPPGNRYNRIQEIYATHNVQWCDQPSAVHQVDHLYSTFLFRKEAGAHGYCPDLSIVGHREETIFTYEMKRAGWDILVDTSARTWDMQQPTGGTRQFDGREDLFEHNEAVFRGKLLAWGVELKHKDAETPTDDPTSAKITSQIGDLQNTLLLPLVGRAKAAAMSNLGFLDEKARQLVSELEGELEDHFRAVDLYSTLSYAARSLKMSAVLETFINDHPGATVINIGAGLDTIFYRVDNGLLHWYDLDLPDVVRLRRRLLPEGPRNRCIPKSLFDVSWCEDIRCGGDGLFMLAGGVFMYYSELEVKEFLVKIATRFPGAEILFDVLSREALSTMNETISKSSGKNSPIRWGIDEAAEIRDWSSRIRLVEQTPYFGHLERRAEWGETVLKQICEADERRVSSYVHLRVEG